VNAVDHNTVEIDFQCFAEADALLAAAIDRIEEGRSVSAATCDFLLDLLETARMPLRRLGGLQ